MKEEHAAELESMHAGVGSRSTARAGEGDPQVTALKSRVKILQEKVQQQSGVIVELMEEVERLAEVENAMGVRNHYSFRIIHGKSPFLGTRIHLEIRHFSTYARSMCPRMSVGCPTLNLSVTSDSSVECTSTMFSNALVLCVYTSEALCWCGTVVCVCCLTWSLAASSSVAVHKTFSACTALLEVLGIFVGYPGNDNNNSYSGPTVV